MTTEARIVEVATLTPEKQKKFVSPWLVVFPCGYVLGCSSEDVAEQFSKVKPLTLDQIRKD